MLKDIFEIFKEICEILKEISESLLSRSDPPWLTQRNALIGFIWGLTASWETERIYMENTRAPQRSALIYIYIYHTPSRADRSEGFFGFSDFGDFSDFFFNNVSPKFLTYLQKTAYQKLLPFSIHILRASAQWAQKAKKW